MSKLFVIRLLTLGSLLFQIINCTPMNKDDFCTALKNNDRAAVGKFMQPVLAEIKPVGPARQEGFDRIKSWIEGHDCVESVEMGPGLLRSEPPLKEFLIRMKGAAEAPVRIRITVYPEKLQFHAE